MIRLSGKTPKIQISTEKNNQQINKDLKQAIKSRKIKVHHEANKSDSRRENILHINQSERNQQFTQKSPIVLTPEGVIN